MALNVSHLDLCYDRLGAWSAGCVFFGFILRSVEELQTKLLPRIHSNDLRREEGLTTSSCLCPRSPTLFTKCDPRHGKYMACCVMH